MRVRVFLNLGSAEFGSDALPEGEHDVSDQFGQRLIAMKLACEVSPKPKASSSRTTPIKAVPTTDVADAKPTELKTSEPAGKSKGDTKSLD